MFNLEEYFRKRFIRLHGEGEAYQSDLYRCNDCGKLVTWNRIRSGVRCCGGRVVTTEPTRFEAIRLFVTPGAF